MTQSGESKLINPSPSPHRQFTFTVVAPIEDQAANIRRLRAALKCLLRTFRLRCVSVLPQPADDAEATPRPVAGIPATTTPPEVPGSSTPSTAGLPLVGRQAF